MRNNQLVSIFNSAFRLQICAVKQWLYEVYAAIKKRAAVEGLRLDSLRGQIRAVLGRAHRS